MAHLGDWGHTAIPIVAEELGVTRWMAPEISMEAQNNGALGVHRLHTPASDVFSFGMCMLQVNYEFSELSAMSQLTHGVC